MTKPLFVFEIANNHGGSVDTGRRIVESCARVAEPYRNVFDFAVKMQYRHRLPRSGPYVERFRSTWLEPEQRLQLRRAMSDSGLVSVCTPFDEESVVLAVEHGYQVLKVASCSTTDWPLLEAVSESGLPVVVSTAGDLDKDLRQVVAMFDVVTLMHCVAEYPTENPSLSRIRKLGEFCRSVGWSSHERSGQYRSTGLAMALGARTFERHVCVEPTNKYSLQCHEVDDWLKAARYDWELLQERTYVPQLDGLRRGLVADGAGFRLESPLHLGQWSASDVPKCAKFVHAAQDGEPLTKSNCRRVDFCGFVSRVANMVARERIHVPMVLSHHHGIADFEKTGAAMFTLLDGSTVVKTVVMLPNQNHPKHRHPYAESYIVSVGELVLTVDGVMRSILPGMSAEVPADAWHEFRGGPFGVVFNEHRIGGPTISEYAERVNECRKTVVEDWK